MGVNEIVNLGRYEVVRELGKGAMGVVYLAKDPLIGRLVALKTIRVTPGSDDDEAREFQQRFMREAQAAGILSHPSIVTVHDIGQDAGSGTTFIAMEYVEGPNLKEILNQGRPLEWEEISEVIAQVADALDYAHSKGIVHRDVKPANIILCGESRAKITDFGIAKIASMAGNLTTTGQFLGTPNYMAPEQIKGAPVDGRTDIFSLGIVLYEALTRRKPFSGESLTTISYKIVHEPYLNPREINPRIPEAFDAIVLKCLAKEPAERFQRARDLAVDLREIARGSSMAAAAEPMMFEQTQALGGGVELRTPTAERPFPDAPAGAPADEEIATISLSRKPATITRQQPRKAELKVLLRKRVPTALFLAIIVLLLSALTIASLAIWQNRVPVPPVDFAREQLVMKQRALRIEGHRLWSAGDIDGAHTKFTELQKLAPRSPAVRQIVARLDEIRMQRMTELQRLTESKLKLAEGQKLYEAREFEKAIPLFEQAFHLDPDSETAVNYLRMLREQMSLEALRRGSAQRPPAAERRTSATTPVRAQGAEQAAGPATPSALVTVLNSPVTEGYIMVKVDGQTVLHENLWTERKSGIFRRRAPRELNEYREIAGSDADVQVWVIIPSLKISEHRTFRKNFVPGTIHRLVVSVDAAAKRVDMKLS